MKTLLMIAVAAVLQDDPLETLSETAEEPLVSGALIMPEAQEQTPGLPYSPVVEANGVLYLAGHLGRDPETRELAGEIEAETEQTLKNIGATLQSAGATYADVVRCQVFLADIKDFDAMNAVYRTFFPENPPARTTVAVRGLALDARIEIECTAVKRKTTE